nr:unnamed protein product [Spirometra erinaceieuropaei]
MKVELPHLYRFKELKAFWRAGDSVEGITFQTHSKPRDSRDVDIFLFGRSTINEHCVTANEHLLRWRAKENKHISPLIDCWLNGRRICVTYEHQGNFSLCNYTKHGQASEIIIKAHKMKNLVDNFVCKINGKTSHSQTIYWNESAIAMSEGRFIYHDFDKIRTRQYAILYWIIDTSNYKISNFYCEDDQGILCSLNDSENKCHLQSFDDVAIYTHKLEHTAAKLESLQCVLNDKYKSRKSVIWDDNYFPHSERTHRHH